MEYYYKPRHSNYYELPPLAPGSTDGSQGTGIEMSYPKNNARIYIPLEIDGKRGQVIFNAAHSKRSSKIFWHLDNTFVGKTTTLHHLALEIPPGEHSITQVDDKGTRISQRFDILANSRKKTAQKSQTEKRKWIV